MKELPISIGNGCFRDDLNPNELFITVQDVEGSYTIPYIQSSRSLEIHTQELPSTTCSIDLSLRIANKVIGRAELNSEFTSSCFDNLDVGDYTLTIEEKNEIYKVGQIGVGLVICAIGDSLTEGYYGRAFWRDSLSLSAKAFHGDSVSKDGRNFPQFAPTAHQSWPQYNCFQSWMTTLNNLLAKHLKQPVFIANEGLGGHTTGDYLNMICINENWHKRISSLSPNIWLIHLGVNDERQKVPEKILHQNLKEIINILKQKYHAKNNQIYIAKPSYDYCQGAEKYLKRYCRVIENLIRDLDLNRGPDFYSAFSEDQQKWYNDDPVHPNEQGVNHMANLWFDSIANSFEKGCHELYT